MRKIILTALGASLIAASTMQMAIAAEHHDGRKADRVSTSQQFRNANDSLAWPARLAWSSDYSEGHVISAPAGR
jgi:predicted phage tail protein